MEKKFKSNELVWAKIRGFPWWPAVIGNVIYDNNSERKVKVFFIGDKTHAELPDSKIEKFDLKYQEYSKTRQRSLLNSINIANNISRGEDGVLRQINRKNFSYNFNLQLKSQRKLKNQLKSQMKGLNDNPNQLSIDNFIIKENPKIYLNNQNLDNKQNENTGNNKTNTEKNKHQSDSLGNSNNITFMNLIEKNKNNSNTNDVINLVDSSSGSVQIVEFSNSSINTRNKSSVNNGSSTSSNKIKSSDNKNFIMDKHTKIHINRRLSYCSSEINKKNNTLINCLKEKEIELSKLNKNDKLLNKKRLIRSKRLRLKSKRTCNELGQRNNSDYEFSDNDEKSGTGISVKKQSYCLEKVKKSKFNFDSNFSYYFMPKRSSRARRKNRLYYPENNLSEGCSSESSEKHSILNGSSDAENQEIELKKQLKSELNELVFYKIEMPSASSNKKIISSIDRIMEKINAISDCERKNEEFKENRIVDRENKKKSLSFEDSEIELLAKKRKRTKKSNKNFKDFSIYEIFKDIMPILNCLINHKNSEIAQKIYELHSLVKQIIIEEIFENKEIRTEKIFNSKDVICSNYSNIVDTDEDFSSESNKRFPKRIKNAHTNKFNINDSLKIKKNKNLHGLIEIDEKNKIEDLKKQILNEISASTTKFNLFSNDNNKLTLNSFKNLSTKSNKNKVNPIKDSVENFDKISFELNTFKLGVGENLKSTKMINICNTKPLINESIPGLKSGFYNKECKRKLGNKEFSNNENMSINENINNNCFSESYNMDSSIISVKENMSNRTNLSGINKNLRKNSSIEKKDKILIDITRRQNSINSKKNEIKKYQRNYYEISKSDETNSIGEISLSNCTNSSKTDCEEIHQKRKIKIVPFSKNEIFSLFQEFGGNLHPLCTEEDFGLALYDNIKFKNIIENDMNRLILPVKFAYLRKRVCHKLYKVLSKLLKHLDLDEELLKKISILFEYSARKEDPLMSNKYKDLISSIFQNIKMTLLSKLVNSTDSQILRE